MKLAIMYRFPTVEGKLMPQVQGTEGKASPLTRKQEGCHDGALWYGNRHQTSGDSQVRTHATPTKSRATTDLRPQHQVIREISWPICGLQASYVFWTGQNNLDSHPQDSRNFLEFISRPIIPTKSLGEALHHNRRHTHNPSLCGWLQTSSKLLRRNSKPWRARKSSVKFPTLFTSAYLYSSCQEAGSHAGTTGFLFMSGSMTANLYPTSMTSKLFWPLSKSQVWWNVPIETHNFIHILFYIFVKSKWVQSVWLAMQFCFDRTWTCPKKVAYS
jgi:hypothetical protein